MVFWVRLSNDELRVRLRSAVTQQHRRWWNWVSGDEIHDYVEVLVRGRDRSRMRKVITELLGDD